jgi:hypothetical protein
MKTQLSAKLVVALTLLAAGGGFEPAHALSTAFTYQGQLRQGGSAANGTCDFQFGLFDAVAAGNAIGTPQANTNVNVSNGLFTVQMDFGATAFTGANRWLEISVRCPAGGGTFTTLSPRQELTAAPYALFAPVVARDLSGNPRASLDVLPSGEGHLQLVGPGGNANVNISSINGNSNHGAIALNDENGNQHVFLGVLNTGEGYLATQGPAGNDNVRISSLIDHPDNGFLAVQGGDGMIHAGIYVDATGKGIVFGDTKNFVVDYPDRPGAKIMYVSLEGPEAAIYHRGVVHLRAGRATIQLPEHFVALADLDTITVQLTPGSLESEGLGFGAIHNGRIEVGELHHGRGTYDVHFVVHAVRRGYETQAPVLSADEFRKRFPSASNPRVLPVSSDGAGANNRTVLQ